MTLQEIEEFIADADLSDEGRRYTAQRKLLEIDLVLSGMVADGDVDMRVLVAHARCATALQAWERAVERWLRVLAAGADDPDRARLELGVAYGSTGNYVQARRAFHGLSRRAKKRKAVQKRILRLQRWERTQAVQSLSDLLLEVDERDDATICGIIHACLLLRGVSTKAAATLSKRITGTLAAINGRSANTSGKVSLRSRLARIARAFGVSRITPGVGHGIDDGPPAGAVPVFICGLGWSGSGAMYDYLRQFSEVATPFRGSEVKVYEGACGVGEMLAPAAIGDYRPLLRQFILRQVWGITPASDLTPAKAYNQSLVRHCPERRMADVEAATRALVQGCTDGSSDTLEMHLGRWARSIVSMLAGRSRYVLLNNWIHGQNVGLVRAVPGAKVYVVLRDPRDQYVDRANELNRGARSLSAFVREMQESMAALQDASEVCEGWASRLHVLRFEDFVLNSDVREGIARELGLTGLRGEVFFEPDRSCRNIGIYRSHPDQEAISRIEQELGFILKRYPLQTVRAGPDGSERLASM